MRDKILTGFLILLVFLLFYITSGFMLIRGDMKLLLISFIPLLITYNFLKNRFDKTYLFLFLISIFFLNITFVTISNQHINSSTERILIHGKINRVNNNFKYVYFDVDKYPEVNFKSYNKAVRDSFKIYTPAGSYDKIPAYIGKNVEFQVLKSHYEWVSKPPVSYLFGFPKEIEIDSIKIVAY